MADKMSIDKKTNPSAPAGRHQQQHQQQQHPSSHLHLDHQDPGEHHDSDDSLGSCGEEDHVPPAAAGAISNAHSLGLDGQQPKRKGGRKPIYATSEERKQRNRQAQAAFRERRTEYIKQLEETIRVHESNLNNLQTAHRTAADECLMLRYKNSLLERVLLEKGIDVQAELQAKTGSPNLGPTHMPQNLVQPPPIQRAIMNRHNQSRRANSAIAPKTEVGNNMPTPHRTTASPRTRPTPPSHSNSPTNTAQGFSPAASDTLSMKSSITTMPRQQIHPLPPPQVQRQHPQPRHAHGPPPVSAGAAYYPTPAFQNHIEQLEQEYDAQADIMDDSELETPSGPGPYPSNFHNEGPQLLSPSSNGHSQHMSQHDPSHHHQTSNQPYPSMTQLLDQQSLDWDPFGLSASMAFPPQPYSLDQHNMR